MADVVPGDGKAIVLLAHYDSVPAGPGASDDESGVATVLETIRALKARGGQNLRPVMAVLTDGEEAGLLGANAFLQNAALKARVGVVVNVEARGTRGQSLLFQTSPGDGRLIDLYAASVPVPATSSLYAEIYKFLPNDTDLTLFIRAGFPSFNFAFADNVRYYHSPFDLRSNLDPATLQMHGDNLLGVAAALEKTDFAALKGDNEIYVSVLGILLPRLPANWALPLSILVFAAIAAAAWLARNTELALWRGTLSAAAMPPVLLLLCGLFGWLLSIIAQAISGHPDPTYAYPIAMRVALGLAVWSATLFVSRMATAKSATVASWLWIAAFAVVTAAFLPGVSPYFLFPALVAAVILLVIARVPGGWSGNLGQSGILLSALAALVIWFPLVASGETLMGLRLHPLFTVPAAFGLLTIVPLLAARPMNTRSWTLSVGIGATAAIACAAIAGLLPSYSAASPQRVDLIYLENDGKPARWIANTSWKATSTESIPAPLIKAGGFTYDSDAWSGLGLGDGYTASAGAPRFPLPTAIVRGDWRGAVTRTVTLELRASADAGGMMLHIPKSAKLVSLDIRGQRFTTDGWSGDTLLLCLTSDCRTLDVTLGLITKDAVSLVFAEQRYGLPDFGARLQAARPAIAMASQSGDETVLANTIKLPAR